MKRLRGVWMVFLVLALLLALLPAQADFGTNWTATFFNRPDLTGTSVQIGGINGINFNWQAGPPVVNGATVNITNCADNISANVSPNCQDYFSARFTSVQALTPGTYEFVVAADDGVRVYINNVLRLDRWQDQPLTTHTFTEVVTISPVNITVEYYERVDQAVIQVQWFLQGAPTPFGTPFLTLAPLPTAVPPLSAQVEGVRGLSIRTGPYLGASFVGVAVPGQTYTPTARSQDEGGPYTWYYITAGDKSGWVSGRYLAFTGDPNSVPVQGTIFDQIDDAPAVGAFASPRSVMNFRRRPSVRAASIGQIPWGAQLELVGRTVQGGNNHWLQVRYEGRVGWIFAPYVSVSGDINAVPIR